MLHTESGLVPEYIVHSPENTGIFGLKKNILPEKSPVFSKNHFYELSLNVRETRKNTKCVEFAGELPGKIFFPLRTHFSSWIWSHLMCNLLGILCAPFSVYLRKCAFCNVGRVLHMSSWQYYLHFLFRFCLHPRRHEIPS